MADGSILVVVYTERESRIRLISARRATRYEQENTIVKMARDGTLRDWEQGRSQPDQPVRAYLAVIARDPEHVRKALQREPV
jgi:putative transcriptional regulator